jgi:hypothetical protein
VREKHHFGPSLSKLARLSFFLDLSGFVESTPTTSLWVVITNTTSTFYFVLLYNTEFVRDNIKGKKYFLYLYVCVVSIYHHM